MAILKKLETKHEQKYWAHPVNQKRVVIYFLSELKFDPNKVYNYTRMSVTSFEFVSEEFSIIQNSQKIVVVGSDNPAVGSESCAVQTVLCPDSQSNTLPQP